MACCAPFLNLQYAEVVGQARAAVQKGRLLPLSTSPCKETRKQKVSCGWLIYQLTVAIFSTNVLFELAIVRVVKIPRTRFPLGTITTFMLLNWGQSGLQLSD